MEAVLSHYVLTVKCKSARGVVAAISGYLAGAGCNLTDSAHFDDRETGDFFMRVSFLSERGLGLAALADGFGPTVAGHGMTFEFHDEAERMKVLLMVSRLDHCLNDILYRWAIGALRIDIVGVVSNHQDCRATVEARGIPFHHVPVDKTNKPEAEAKQLAIVEATGAELVVLARYMQILSDAMCRKLSGRIINIHHSFLPSFKGARPYHRAFERGVKLIGATSHYVTSDLDEGPIIEQDIVRVTHAQNADDFVSLGRDVESQVLARAIHAHVHHRVFINGAKTVVFPASPGSYAAGQA